MGCPKHFSTHGNMGSNLLYIPELSSSILKRLRSGLRQDIFLSCKIRLLEDFSKTKEFIKVIEATGIDFFTVHMRTKHQTAKNKANWSMMPEIKKVVSVPVFANGDIFNYQDYLTLIKCKVY